MQLPPRLRAVAAAGLLVMAALAGDAGAVTSQPAGTDATAVPFVPPRLPGHKPKPPSAAQGSQPAAPATTAVLPEALLHQAPLPVPATPELPTPSPHAASLGPAAAFPEQVVPTSPGLPANAVAEPELDARNLGAPAPAAPPKAPSTAPQHARNAPAAAGPSPAALPPLPADPTDQPPPPATSFSTVAALPEPPPGAAPAPSAAGRIVFEGASTELSPSAQDVLNDMARRLGERENARLALRSYATPGSGTPIQARQVSLARALAVRAYLMGKGVRGTRVDVQALGPTADSDPRDRIDLMLMD